MPLKLDLVALPVCRLSAPNIGDRRDDSRCDQGAAVYLVSCHVPPQPAPQLDAGDAHCVEQRRIATGDVDPVADGGYPSILREGRPTAGRRLVPFGRAAHGRASQRLSRAGQRLLIPPSTTSSLPIAKAASSEARKTMALAI